MNVRENIQEFRTVCGVAFDFLSMPFHLVKEVRRNKKITKNMTPEERQARLDEAWENMFNIMHGVTDTKWCEESQIFCSLSAGNCPCKETEMSEHPRDFVDLCNYRLDGEWCGEEIPFGKVYCRQHGGEY